MPDELRDLENKQGVTYDASKLTILFAEDWALLKSWLSYLLGLFDTKRNLVARVGSVSSSATPSINVDDVDIFKITALAVDVTSFTANLSGTPTDNQMLWISITDDGTPRAIAWGASFEASTVALPITTVASARLDVLFVWNTATTKWRCVAIA